MTLISNEDFTDFLEKLQEMNPKYYDTVSELSWPKDENGEKDYERDPLIRSGYRMLSLDDICKGCSKFDSYNLPSTTDALWYHVKDDGGLVLYFIEFKWHNLNRKKDETSCDQIDVVCKLRLKPFESLFIVLPKVFEDYCEKYNKNFTGLNDFLKTCEIKVFTFVDVFDRKDLKLKNRGNKYKYRLTNIKVMGKKGSIGNTVWKQYKRMELNSLIDFADVYPRSFFNKFLGDEDLL